MHLSGNRIHVPYLALVNFSRAILVQLCRNDRGYVHTNLACRPGEGGEN